MLSILSSPSRARGGFAGGHQKLQQNRYQPYLTGWKNQESSRSSGQTGKVLVVVADPGVGAEVVSLDGVPEAPRTTQY